MSQPFRSQFVLCRPDFGLIKYRHSIGLVGVARLTRSDFMLHKGADLLLLAGAEVRALNNNVEAIVGLQTKREPL